MKLVKWGLAFSCLTTLAHAENRVEKLTPPSLAEETIATKIPCIRPMREGIFNISTDEIGGKLIVNCYGHGGCGWTTFLGSVEHAIGLLEKSYPLPSATPPIRVIGSGCMGLSSAIELTRKGYRVTGVTTKELYDIPSWNAAGYFAVVSVKISPEAEEVVNQINFSTFRSYQQIERGTHPYLSANCTRFIPVYSSADTHAGVEELEKQGLIPPREVVDIDFGNGVIHRDFNKYMTYFFDVTNLMQELNAEVARLGIPIDMRKISSFEGESEEIIFNCTGLGGGELVNDHKMIPVRGHLLMLNDKAGQGHMDYMIYTKVKQEGKEEYVYLFPRTSYITQHSPELIAAQGVLGGTFIQDAEKLSAEDLAELDRTEFVRLYERNNEFFYGESLN